MPVLVSTKSQGLTEWEPSRLQRVCAAKLGLNEEPSWRDDPTYDLKAKRNGC
jgi:hypothetical protein